MSAHSLIASHVSILSHQQRLDFDVVGVITSIVVTDILRREKLLDRATAVLQPGDMSLFRTMVHSGDFSDEIVKVWVESKITTNSQIKSFVTFLDKVVTNTEH